MKAGGWTPTRLKQQFAAKAGQIDCLFARCAGVHVDFHAHRQFDDLLGGNDVLL
jgi:hypothetical protein